MPTTLYNDNLAKSLRVCIWYKVKQKFFLVKDYLNQIPLIVHSLLGSLVLSRAIWSVQLSPHDERSHKHCHVWKIIINATQTYLIIQTYHPTQSIITRQLLLLLVCRSLSKEIKEMTAPLNTSIVFIVGLVF